MVARKRRLDEGAVESRLGWNREKVEKRTKREEGREERNECKKVDFETGSSPFISFFWFFLVFRFFVFGVSKFQKPKMQNPKKTNECVV